MKFLYINLYSQEIAFNLLNLIHNYKKNRTFAL